jgi:hypothetical protein
MFQPCQLHAGVAKLGGLAAILLGVAGCPAGQHAGNTQEAVAAPPPSAANETPSAAPQTGDDSADIAPPDEGSPPAESESPPPSAFIDWELDGFKLGMSVPEARSLLKGEIRNHIQERWRYKNLTGVIVAGTYKEPIGMQGSLMFYDGKLVAVIANKLQSNFTFKEELARLGKAYGKSRRDPPEFARGYRFIQAMAEDKNQPDTQYLWADDQTQTLLLAGYYSKDLLATYMLIDASQYDLVAEAMQEIPPSSDAGADAPAQ